ncbi:MAG: hypothetical protein HIU92_17335 [Proteobacteria bacterium]|nr:hypothetical protein [Pseudomonadota bacterium]
MPDWQNLSGAARTQLARIPVIGWMSAALIGASLAAALYLETGAPPYVALYDGLTPAEGGKVIAQLQKLGIPYELEAAGNLILVPQASLASARLRLGASQIPGTAASSGWEKLENAPITTSDLAQTTMAAQALEATLAQSIESLNGISSAQVFLAQPEETPFLADQPKPSASVVIGATDADATSEGSAIASLVAGAVPGLQPQMVTVTTTSGLKVFPALERAAIGSQLAVVSAVEGQATARVATLLLPIVGNGHFRIGASADLDFTHEQVRRVSYGPNQLVSQRKRNETVQTGPVGSAIGIPGALSNEPPAATSAVPPVSAATPSNTSGAGASPTGSTASSKVVPPPQRTNMSSSESYVTDQSESDITHPDWTVRRLSISVVLDKAALKSTPLDQVKAAIAGAFSYPQVSVIVVAAPFTPTSGLEQPFVLQQAIGPLTHAVLEVLAAVALLFGLALPMGRRISTLAVPRRVIALPNPRPIEVAAVMPPPLEFSALRDQAAKNVPAVARLLQSWIDDLE